MREEEQMDEWSVIRNARVVRTADGTGEAFRRSGDIPLHGDFFHVDGIERMRMIAEWVIAGATEDSGKFEFEGTTPLGYLWKMTGTYRKLEQGPAYRVDVLVREGAVQFTFDVEP